ncbi:MAG: elongation factor 4 [Oscillospiraceae bacterium]|nr:elongation factor 4 [Oscillospiraceae bacterium]
MDGRADITPPRGRAKPLPPAGRQSRGITMDQTKIRNFSIIAHIDHGKSTLADRLLEACGAVSEREMESQLLDNMDLEKERGITIKARAVTLSYDAQDGETYTLNLIDTPGHVDFNYEVSRSLAACEGAVLVVDASQGIEAQTLANTYLALDNDLEIRPVINKIDLPAADPERVKHEIEDIIGIPALDAPEISAKVGLNIPAVLENVVQSIPAPAGDPNAPLRALIFDSYYDAYKGVIVYFRIMDGTLKKGMPIRMMASNVQYQVLECGLLRPLGYEPCDQLQAGQVGYLTASIKNVQHTEVGDTITGVENPAAEPLPGYRKARSMVYCGIYTEDGSKYPDLRDALEKLQLNDASLTFEPESSVALGFGFRCGFLGMLHMEVIQERLEREFDLDLITTMPSVIYRVTKSDGSVVNVDNPHNYPDPSVITMAEEPYVKVSIISPNEYVGNIMPLCQDRRGEFKDMQYLDTHLVELHYQMPLNEIIYDFFDTLKAHTKGYASLDYELSDYRESDLVKVDLLLNGDQVDALSFIAHRDKAYPRARRLCEKLKENIPRQLFEVPIQAAIGGRIIARETVKAMRKDVLAKCYGGDITRKKKLLEKQKEGKKKMRNLGTVQLPTEAFMAVLKLDE